MALKEMRKKAGFTAREVATKLGVSFQNVYNWEAGSYNPRSAQLYEMAKLYGCSMEDLMKPAQDSA